MFKSRQLSRRLELELVSQWRVLLEGGYGLVRALEWMARENPHAGIRRVCDTAVKRLHAGAVLEEAFAEVRPRVSPDLLARLESGRVAGNLAEHLRLLEELARLRMELGNRLWTAMAYPLTVLTVGLGIALATVLWIVPRFESLYAELLDGHSLPWLTRQLLTVVDVLRGSLHGGGLWLLAGVLGAGTLAQRNRGCRLVCARLADRLPLIGDWRRSLRSSRFCLELASLLRNRVRPVDALEQMRGRSVSPAWDALLDGAQQALRTGRSLAGSLQRRSWLQPEAVALMAAGEAGGDLVRQLEQAGQWARRRQERATDRIAAWVEPLLISLLSLVMGTVALALFLPLVVLIQEMSRNALF